MPDDIEEIACDVLVVGSGLTGMIAAEAAVKAGLDTVVLERGDEYLPDDTNRRTWWREDTEPDGPPTADGFQRFRNHWPWAEEGGFNDLVSNESYGHPWGFQYNMWYGIGGAARMWSGLAWRLHPDDFRTRSLHGYGTDWPLSYDELAPWYDLAETRLEVAGPQAPQDPRFWPWQNNFAYPAFKHSYLDRELQRIFGADATLLHQPHAVRNRPADEGGCVGAKTCVKHCPTNAIFRPNDRFLPEILFAPNFQLHALSPATHLEVDDGGTVTGVRFCQEGRAMRARARHVFLAANAVENARILLNSGRLAGKPVANGSGQLGRHFASHGAVTFRLHMQDKVYPQRGRPTNASALDWLAGPERDRVNGHILEIWNSDFSTGNTPWEHLRNIHQREGHWGATLLDKVLDFERRTDVVFVFEREMTGDSFITLAERTDKFGLPIARTVTPCTYRDFATIRRIDERAQALFARPGIARFECFGRGVNGNHPLGGIRMSASPSDGVVDTWCRAHDHPNLYVLGGGAFCSTSALNPTLTIAALALRAVRDPRLGW